MTREEEAPVLALNEALAAEHAAVFAYPVIAARLSRLRDRALDALAEHEGRRDRLIGLLEEAGAEAVAPLAVYQLPAIEEADDARRLAQGLEEACLAPYARVVALTEGESRRIAAAYLSRAAAAFARWGGEAAAFPGLGPTGR